MWELDYEESWVPKNWCFWTVVLEKTLESPLDSKEIQPVHSKGNQSWVFFGRTDAKAETAILWLSHAKSWLIGKDSDSGRDWNQEEKGMTEDEMAGWHHLLDEHEFVQTSGMLWFMGLQRFGHNWATGLNWTEDYYTRQRSHSSWWRNQKLYRQAKFNRIQHHQTSLATNTKGTYIASKHKRKERPMKTNPPKIKKMPIGTYVSIITLNINGLNAPTKRYRLTEWIQNRDPYICCWQETHFIPRDT